MLVTVPYGVQQITPICCSDSSVSDKRRLRARVAYDGTNYNGWQFQLNSRSIQAEIEHALNRRVGHPVRVVGASRTDAGVHARGQAFHIDMPHEFPCSEIEHFNKLEYVLNQMLPPDIRVTRLGRAPVYKSRTSKDDPDNLHEMDWIERTHLWSAMYDSVGKLYSYRFSVGPILDPMLRLYCYHEWRASKFGFCEQRLHNAADKFVGTHDFTAFANSFSRPLGIKAPVEINPYRTVHSINILKESADVFRLEFHIDGAFYKMIRNVMGTILDIACYQRDVECIEHLLKSRDRQQVSKSAPARGLCLEEVFYDNWVM